MASFDKLKPKFGPFLSAATPRPLSSISKEKAPVNLDQNRPHHASNQLGSRHVQVNEEQGDNYPMEEGQGSTGTNFQPHNGMPEINRGQLGQKERQSSQEQLRANREEEINNIVEGSWLGKFDKLDIPTNFIDLTSQSTDDPNQVVIFTPSPFGPELLANGQEAQTESASWMSAAQHLLPLRSKKKHLLPLTVLDEIGGTSDMGKPNLEVGECSLVNKQLSDWNVETAYRIELPSEENLSITPFTKVTMDLATEKDLIKSWNHRFTLKRERVVGSEMEELEDIQRMKKQKKESWYDDDGNLVCVTITSAQGSQTFVMNDEGGLKPLSP